MAKKGTNKPEKKVKKDDRAALQADIEIQEADNTVEMDQPAELELSLEERADIIKEFNEHNGDKVLIIDGEPTAESVEEVKDRIERMSKDIIDRKWTISHGPTALTFVDFMLEYAKNHATWQKNWYKTIMIFVERLGELREEMTKDETKIEPLYLDYGSLIVAHQFFSNLEGNYETAKFISENEGTLSSLVDILDIHYDKLMQENEKIQLLTEVQTLRLNGFNAVLAEDVKAVEEDEEFTAEPLMYAMRDDARAEAIEPEIPSVDEIQAEALSNA